MDTVCQYLIDTSFWSLYEGKACSSGFLYLELTRTELIGRSWRAAVSQVHMLGHPSIPVTPCGRNISPMTTYSVGYTDRDKYIIV